jgi:hypothetical protein
MPLAKIAIEGPKAPFVWLDYFLGFIAVESKYRQLCRPTVTPLITALQQVRDLRPYPAATGALAYSYKGSSALEG